MRKKDGALSNDDIKRFVRYLKEEERSAATIEKYTRDINALIRYLGSSPVTKTGLMEWKKQLCRTYAPASVNSMLAATNSFLVFLDRKDLTVKPLRIQRTLFIDQKKELTREDYVRLVRAAEREENKRLLLVLQTLCATGIRVSELRFITKESVCDGRAVIVNKSKRRIVFLPEKLCWLLSQYLSEQNRTSGPVFVTRSGKPLDRSNIWREMKALCRKANVDPEKVFPHNLRHLFARTFYTAEKDLGRLADILGHSSIDTTRIYTAESGASHARKVEQLHLIIT